MKGNHWFIAGIIVFLVLMFAIECRLPKKFFWNRTFVAEGIFVVEKDFL